MYQPQNEPVTFARDCEAVLIPAGEHVTLPEGSTGYVTQALGGSFTVYIEGNLFRIAGTDGDADERDGRERGMQRARRHDETDERRKDDERHHPRLHERDEIADASATGLGEALARQSDGHVTHRVSVS